MKAKYETKLEYQEAGVGEAMEGTCMQINIIFKNANKYNFFKRGAGMEDRRRLLKVYNNSLGQFGKIKQPLSFCAS